jgi:hypothetical protein
VVGVNFCLHDRCRSLHYPDAITTADAFANNVVSIGALEMAKHESNTNNSSTSHRDNSNNAPLLQPLFLTLPL